MSLRFYLISGASLPIEEGVPPNYSSVTLAGANARHISQSFGTIVMFEYRYNQVSICLTVINWKQPERLICEMDNPPVLFCRTMLSNTLYKSTKGIGTTFLKKDHFTALAGTKWTTLLISEKAGEHRFVDMTWSNEFLRNALTEPEALEFYDGLPQKLCDIPLKASIQMKHAIEDLLNIEYGFTHNKMLFSEASIKYLSMVVWELKEKLSLKKKMSEVEWHYVSLAKQIIDDRPNIRFSTPEISLKIGLNEFKLKKLFPMIVGYPVDEYRKYRLFTNAGKSIVQDRNMPLKNASDAAGYKGLAAFIRAFKGICHCTPGELRTDSWDTSRITGIQDVNWDEI